jgi:hypothetical protein
MSNVDPVFYEIERWRHKDTGIPKGLTRCIPKDQPSKTKFNYVQGDDSIALDDFVSENILGDCWGIVINDEVVYNEYDKTRSYRDIILEEVVRNGVASHRIIRRFKKGDAMQIYLFEKDPLCIHIECTGDNDNTTWPFKVSYFS